jgi:hypothetical protein
VFPNQWPTTSTAGSAVTVTAFSAAARSVTAWVKSIDTGVPAPEVEFASGVKQPANVSPGDFVANADVCSAGPAAFTVTVYSVPEYGFLSETRRVRPSSKDPARVGPSSPDTSTADSAPSVTEATTGSVKSALFVPSAGETVTVGVLTCAFAFVPAPVPSVAAVSSPSVAPAGPPHPLSARAGAAVPNAARTPRRDQVRRPGPGGTRPGSRGADRGRFDISGTPTERLFPVLSLATVRGAPCGTSLG